MPQTRTSLAASLLILTASLTAAPTPPDPSATFADIETSIAAHDYYQADNLLGSLANNLLALHIPPPVGQAHREAWDSGRANSDLVGLVRQARLAWSQAARNEQPWDEVMRRLLIASGSAVALDTALPPAVRYELARTRYAATPSIILLHQLTLRTFEAHEYAAALKYVTEERAETPHFYPPESAGLILNRLDTLLGILKLAVGDTAGALQALADSASDIRQTGTQNLREAPRMSLAQQLLHAGQSAPVLAYLEVCAQFEYPGGEPNTDVGKNPRAPSQLIAAIHAGVEPQFGALDIY